MSLSSIQPSWASQTSTRLPRWDGADPSGAAGGASRHRDTVSLSQHARQMARLSALGPATPQHLRNLSDSLAGDLNNSLRQASIDTRAGIGIEVDASSGRVRVQGDGAAANNVAAVIGRQPALLRRIQDVATLSQHLATTEQGDALNKAQENARQIAQMNAVAAGYAARFETPGAMPPSDLTPIQRSSLPAGNERIASSYGAIGGGSSGAANVAFKINGASMDVFINGKEWLSSAG